MTQLTEPVSAPLPLPLRSVMQERVKVPSFPMEPYKMPCDLYECMEDVACDGDKLRRRAPHQSEVWWLEPHYKGCVPVVIEAKTGLLYTNRGYLMQGNYILDKEAIEAIKSQYHEPTWPAEVEWIHGLRFYNTFTTDGKVTEWEQCILIVDLVVRGLTYLQRRVLLEKNFDQLGFKRHPQAKMPYLVPRYTEEEAPHLWAALHLQNQLFGPNSELYTGIVEKRSDSPYIFQTDDDARGAMSWIYHPFDSTT